MVRPKIALSEQALYQLKQEALEKEKTLSLYLSELILKGWQIKEANSIEC